MQVGLWLKFLSACKALTLSAGLTLAVGAIVTVCHSASARAEIGPWIAIDAGNGSVIEESNSRRQWYPASITKLMTAYVTFKAIRAGQANMRSLVTVSANAHAEPPSKMGFKVGTKLTLDNALKMMLVKSANDIAVAVAEAIGGDEASFIPMMNAEARRLGMTATRFVNPHGLPDPGQVSSARDLALLARTVWREFPQYRDYYDDDGIRFGGKTLKSANREFLLRVRGANGMKTGYICDAGFNVAASVTRGGRTIIVVILGAASGLERTAFARELIDRSIRKKGRLPISSFTGVTGRPPAARYCKRNAKPDADELMARFAGAGSDGGSATGASLAYVKPASASGRPLLPGVAGATTDANDGDDENLVPTKNGRTDWAKVMDAIIGPRLRSFRPINVSVGAPGGARPPHGDKASVVARQAAPQAVSARPAGKPLDLRPTSSVTNSHGVRMPGAIYSSVPLPGRHPNR